MANKNPVSVRYLRTAAGNFDPRLLEHLKAESAGTPGVKTPMDNVKNILKDKSGLGTVAGVAAAATLAYLMSRGRENRLIAKAVKEGLPVSRNIMNPALAFGGGGAAALTAKHLWDRYNNKRAW